MNHSEPFRYKFMAGRPETSKMRRRGLKIRSMKEAAIAGLAVIAIAGAAFGALDLGLYRPSVGERGQVTADGANGRRTTAATRQVIIRNYRFWQVEVAPNVWKDCGSDCAKVLRRAMSD
jgi:hypothetical protein